jgi:hypothetical protein
MRIERLLDRAVALGVSIETIGDRLLLLPAEHCPLDFVEEVRRNKSALLEFLGQKAASAEIDRARWLPVARQILAGEFDGADAPTMRTVKRTLRRLRHHDPIFPLAVERLVANNQR